MKAILIVAVALAAVTFAARAVRAGHPAEPGPEARKVDETVGHVVKTDAESPIPKIFFSTVKFACML